MKVRIASRVGFCGIAVRLLLGSMLLAGCGSASAGKHGASSAAEAQTAASTHDNASSRAQAAAFADAVLLRPDDLPSFKSHKAETGSESHSTTQLARCTAIGDARALVERKSDKFERETDAGSLYASSEVEVLASAQIAEKQLAAVRSAKFMRCLTQALEQSLASESGHSTLKGGSLHHVSAASLSPSAPGASGFGWIAQATLRYRGIAFPFSMEFEGFVRGRAVVLLITAAVPGRFPSALERALFATLLERAKTQSP